MTARYGEAEALAVSRSTGSCERHVPVVAENLLLTGRQPAAIAKAGADHPGASGARVHHLPGSPRGRTACAEIVTTSPQCRYKWWSRTRKTLVQFPRHPVGVECGMLFDLKSGMSFSWRPLRLRSAASPLPAGLRLAPLSGQAGLPAPRPDRTRDRRQTPG